MSKLHFLKLCVVVFVACKPKPQTTFDAPGAEPLEIKAVTQDVDCDWPLKNTHVFEAWKQIEKDTGRKPGQNVRVVVIDTGIYSHDSHTLKTHPEIQTDAVDVSMGTNFLENSGKPFSVPQQKGLWDHGTLTAAVIASPPKQQKGTQGLGHVTGVAPFVKLIPVRATTDIMFFKNGPMGWYAGQTDDVRDTKNKPETLEKAIRWAVDSAKADVISMSLGSEPTQGLEEAVKYAARKGAILVASAGQHVVGTLNIVPAPGRYKEVISVSASTKQNSSWPTNVASELTDVAAPGVEVCFPWIPRGADKMPLQPVKFTVLIGQGTSFSVAFMAGVAALWVSYHGKDKLIKTYGEGQIWKAFYNAVTKFGTNNPEGWERYKFGAGIIDAHKLIDASLPSAEYFFDPK